MMSSQRVTKEDLIKGYRALGLKSADVVLARAALKPVGRVSGGASAVIEALLEIIGPEGTLVSLAFTQSYFLRKADPNKPFTLSTPTYAGAFPQAMLDRPDSVRSSHPTCSYVAIGRHAQDLLAGHGPNSGAYEPVRRLIELQAKGALIGCVASSPGLTTAHLAECDLGMHRRVIAPWATSVYYIDDAGQKMLFRRKDHGLCSISFRKFYGHYVTAGVLRSAFVGNAYSICVPLEQSYGIERAILSREKQFNICGEPDCIMCNGRRWDRIHHLPRLLFRRLLRRLDSKKLAS